MNHVEKARNWTAPALFAAALIQCLLGFVAWSMNGRGFGPLDWIAAFSGILYVVLAVAARKVPFAAAVLGVGLYASYLVLQALHGCATLRSGLIFKIPVMMLLLLGLWLALRLPLESPGKEKV